MVFNNKVFQGLCKALDDFVFLVSVVLFLVILFIACQGLKQNPPPLAFNNYGPLFVPSESFTIETDQLLKQPVNREAVIFYKITVRHAETLSLLALQRGMQVDTLLSVNKFKKMPELKSGQIIIMPDRDGLLHQVKAHQTLESLALFYSQSKDRIMATNNLHTEKLFAGQELFIEGATYPAKTREKMIGSAFFFPVPGLIVRFYGTNINRLTGLAVQSDGIDILTIDHQAVLNVATGVVAESGFHPTYGYYIIVSHQDNLNTFYGYLDGLSLKRGSRVERGAVLARVGSSGISNGGLLHFSVFKEGLSIDPLLYLR